MNRTGLTYLCFVGACAQYHDVHGYDDYPQPDLQGEGSCVYCLFSPCIICRPPSFVKGQSGPHARNAQHRYRLYRHFWKALKDLGLWKCEQYLSRKCLITHKDDPREIIPVCVVNVSKKRISTYIILTCGLNSSSGGTKAIS